MNLRTRLKRRYKIAGLVVSLILINFTWAIWVYIVSFNFSDDFASSFLSWCRVVSYFALVDGIYSVMVYVECAKVSVPYKLLVVILVISIGLEVLCWYFLLDERYLAKFFQELKGTSFFVTLLCFFSWFKYKQWKKRQNTVQELESVQLQNNVTAIREDSEVKLENPWKTNMVWMSFAIQLTDLILNGINHLQLAPIPGGLVIFFIVPIGNFILTVVSLLMKFKGIRMVIDAPKNLKRNYGYLALYSIVWQTIKIWGVSFASCQGCQLKDILGTG
jgi:hypothetical protein